ncbi:MAG: hypothetical protein QNJ18_03625 [Xenococcaceae cyanobacterium MO_167.B52]|nr:hypothetical protein [Xenococcaceae cyanobacterium MO_167.B52]
MFNKFKLLLVVILLTIFGILFFQNQEPLSLKILCADTSSQYCWYQTPTEPLAVWMGLFLILGVISSLIWQVLQSLGSSESAEYYDDKSFTAKEKSYSQKVPTSSTKTSKPPKSRSSTSPTDWEYSGQGEDWESEQSPSAKVNPKAPQDDFVRGSNFETRQQPQNINQSGSTYSYKFKKNQKPEQQVNKNADDVYDANYRTINSGKSNEVNQNADPSEDEEEWI